MARISYVRVPNYEEIEHLCDKGYLRISAAFDPETMSGMCDDIEYLGKCAEERDGDVFDEAGVSSMNFRLDGTDLGLITAIRPLLDAIVQTVGDTRRDLTAAVWTTNDATVLRYKPDGRMHPHQDQRWRFIGASVVVNVAQEAEISIYSGDPAESGAVEVTEIMKPGDAMLYVARPFSVLPHDDRLYANSFRWHAISCAGNSAIRMAVSYDLSGFWMIDEYLRWTSGPGTNPPCDPQTLMLYKEIRDFLIESHPHLEDRLSPIEINLQ